MGRQIRFAHGCHVCGDEGVNACGTDAEALSISLSGPQYTQGSDFIDLSQGKKLEQSVRSTSYRSAVFSFQRFVGCFSSFCYCDFKAPMFVARDVSLSFELGVSSYCSSIGFWLIGALGSVEGS
eukprot:IDg17144t1